MINKIRRSSFETKKLFLDFLYNNLGETELRLFYAWQDNGDKKFSRWIRYGAILEDPEKYAYMINKCNNRTQLKCEIIIDIDDYAPFKDFNEKLEYIKDDLKQREINFVVYNSNKSFHIHCIIPELIELRQEERKIIREAILLHYGADIQLAKDNAPIALEGEPHWKSGKIKQEV